MFDVVRQGSSRCDVVVTTFVVAPLIGCKTIIARFALFVKSFLLSPVDPAMLWINLTEGEIRGSRTRSYWR